MGQAIGLALARGDGTPVVVIEKEPGELEIALVSNRDAEDRYRRLGATLVDSTQPIETVVGQLLTALDH